MLSVPRAADVSPPRRPAGAGAGPSREAAPQPHPLPPAASTQRTGPHAVDERRDGGANNPPPPLHTGPVERPNFGLSGALAKDASSGVVYKGVQLKWSEPADARPPPPKDRGGVWRLYCFKGDKEDGAPLPLTRQSAYLVGRDREVADLPMDHPSVSGQHAVLQFRLVPLPQEAGDMSAPVRTVRPYLLDLESTNGTALNGTRVEGARYIELRSQDVLRFGQSSREYVLILEEDDAARGKR
jgi:smad nuclear-interacting protein 1